MEVDKGAFLLNAKFLKYHHCCPKRLRSVKSTKFVILEKRLGQQCVPIYNQAGYNYAIIFKMPGKYGVPFKFSTSLKNNKIIYNIIGIGSDGKLNFKVADSDFPSKIFLQIDK